MTLMAKDRFEQLFDTTVAEPLCKEGFRRAGKSLWCRSNLAVVALIRLGGRMTQPGAISHLVCCRMSFMRDRTEAVPGGFSPSPFDYPFKILPTAFSNNLRYSPQNLRYDYDRLIFQSREEAAVRRDLTQLASIMLEGILPWSANLTVSSVQDQLRGLGQGAWCEKIWIEDCEPHIANSHDQEGAPTS